MKNLARLAAGAELHNTNDGLIVVDIQPFDGGPFELEPKIDAEGIYLVDPARPVRYGLNIRGDIDALDRLAKALLTVVREARKANGTDTEDA